MEKQTSTAARKNAKVLRSGMTDAESCLWRRLRREQLGVKFRRQHPLGPYVLDFACLGPKLVVEVDGSQHMEQAAYDDRRTQWLNEQGYPVMRFWSNEVLTETDGVVQSILDRLSLVSPPAPTPALPQRGRERSGGAADTDSKTPSPSGGRLGRGLLA